MENVAAPRGVKKKWELSIDRDWCKGCAICVALCPRQVLAMDGEGKAVARDLARCTGCLICELHCPDLAIEVKHFGEVRAAGAPAAPAAPGAAEGGA